MPLFHVKILNNVFIFGVYFHVLQETSFSGAKVLISLEQKNLNESCYCKFSLSKKHKRIILVFLKKTKNSCYIITAYLQTHASVKSRILETNVEICHLFCKKQVVK